ncbi:MAG: ferrochelatase [Bdellovibrionales bacterium]|nr:ferrochelatase [Bdellovibrionales bacterium]
MGKFGVLLLNLGTPVSTQVSDVRNYLGEFLMDPYVIDIPWIARAALVHGIILRTRPKKSAEAYQKIWTERGSPLLWHSEDLCKGVAREMGSGYSVKLAMRYGHPSLEKALREFKDEGVAEILFLPLYPQYSYAATLSSLQFFKTQFRKVYSGAGTQPKVRWLKDFYDDPGFLRAFQEQVRKASQEFQPDFTLFSFHGVPERHVQKTDDSGRHCLAAASCCEKITEKNRNCYRAQSFATARELAKLLEIPKDRYAVSFQSRLGRTPWIQPYTDVLYEELAKQGRKRVLVVCPAFVADCLETLEEITIRGRESFQALGGGDLRLVPSLNSSPDWVRTICDWVLDSQNDAQNPKLRFQEISTTYR